MTTRWSNTVGALFLFLFSTTAFCKIRCESVLNQAEALGLRTTESIIRHQERFNKDLRDFDQINRRWVEVDFERLWKVAEAEVAYLELLWNQLQSQNLLPRDPPPESYTRSPPPFLISPIRGFQNLGAQSLQRMLALFRSLKPKSIIRSHHFNEQMELRDIREEELVSAMKNADLRIVSNTLPHKDFRSPLNSPVYRVRGTATPSAGRKYPLDIVLQVVHCDEGAELHLVTTYKAEQLLKLERSYFADLEKAEVFPDKWTPQKKLRVQKALVFSLHKATQKVLSVGDAWKIHDRWKKLLSNRQRRIFIDCLVKFVEETMPSVDLENLELVAQEIGI